MSGPSETTDSPTEANSSPSISVCVGSRQEVIEKRKMRCNVNGRDVVIFYHNKTFYAMDQRCYRKLHVKTVSFIILLIIAFMFNRILCLCLF